MKALMTLTATAAIALVASAGPVRSECTAVITDMKDAIDVASKNYNHSIEEIKGAKDKAKANATFCAVTGEFLGTATGFRAIVSSCLSESEARETVASLSKSIADIQSALDSACK